ncbi:hypothetical protein [uncultured Dysosmobacter sp.]|uniref:hypothetical protein n=1 Tax=uncultured Dysosmobacter sp. TaxID=2591384 RepID=UPI002633EFFC|nr:hypothetical protein [uncultured Dysosmobacter sp.]
MASTKRWNKATVPESGQDMLTEFAAGRRLKISSAYGTTADGDPGTPEPGGRDHPLTIESVTRAGNTVTVCIQVTSIGNQEAYKLERVNIYAQVGDTSGGEPEGEEKILLTVEDEPDESGNCGVTIPAESEQLYSFKLYAVLTVTDGDRLEVSISTAGIATVGAIQDAIDEHSKDKDAHKAAIAADIEEHNQDPEAHPALSARIAAAEKALNGYPTLTGNEDPTAETEGKVGQHYLNLQTGQEWVCTKEQEGSYVWEKVDRKSGLWDTLDSVKKTAEEAKKVADGAAEAIAAVQNTISVVPSQAAALTYSGDKQKPTWNNFSEEMMDVTYGDGKTPATEFQGETNAGTYKAYFTPKGDYTWADKTAKEKEVEWTIQRATIASTPSVKTPLTYSGEEQAPEWNDYSEDKLTKTETKQRDAGEYSTSFTPKDNYQWPGGDTGAKSVQWNIAKAANTLSISPSTAQDIHVGDQVEVTVTTNSDADISAESSQQLFATVSTDTAQKKVTITGAGQGNAVVTISSKGAKNYADAEVKLTVNVTRKNPTFTLNPDSSVKLKVGANVKINVTTDSDGAVSATSDAPGTATASAAEKVVTISGASAGDTQVTISLAQTTKYNGATKKVSVNVYEPKIYGVTWDGNSGTKWTRTDAAKNFTDPTPHVNNGTAGSSPFDTLQPWAGMTVEARTGGQMVKIPKFWYKLEQNGKGLQIRIAAEKEDGYSVSPAHMDRKDGKGERDAIYVGRYHCASDWKSKTGVAPQVSKTRDAFRQGIKTLGAGYSQLDFATRFTIWLLYIVEFADWNSQKVIGKGCSLTSSSSSAVFNMGYTDNMGYHTGTTQNSRDSYGGTQYRNIEGLWDNCYDWCDGCYYDGNGLNIILNPANFSDTAGGTLAGKPSSGWPSAFTVTSAGGFPIFIPTEASGSESTYSCDRWYFNASFPCLCVGGYCSQYGDYGLFYVHFNSASYTSSNIGSRLQELP